MADDPAEFSLPQPAAPPSEAGAIRLRVRYCECDPMGVAHHGSYIAWLEMARTELLRSSGVSYAQLEAAGVLLAIARLEVRYRQSARYDDEIEIHARVTGGGRARIDHDYEVRRLDGSGDAVIATAASTLACIDRAGRPRALPDWLVPSKPTPRPRA